MSDTTVGQYLFLEEWAPLVEALRSAPELRVEDMEGNPQDIVTFLSGEKSALLFVSLGSKDDLVALANLVKMSKRALKDVPHKIIVVNFTGNKNVEKAIMKMGILDILEEGIKPRALRFKIDFWVKSIAHTLKNKPLTETKKEMKSVEVAQVEKRNDSPQWIKPLDQESDIWLVKNELEIKKILGRWLVKIMGPSPHVASWSEIEGQRGIWRFQVKDSHKNLFLLGEGVWIFRGDNKPEYNWKEHLWTMAGDRIELFYQNEKAVFPRFFIKEKVLQIAKNSDFAKTKQAIIEETFNQEHIFKKEVDGPVEIQGIENDGVSFADLKGKSSTDNLGSGPLSGKTKAGADQFSDLDGKGSTDSLDYGAMKGKNKNYSSESGPLEGKSDGESLSSLHKHESKQSSPFVNPSEAPEKNQSQSGENPVDDKNSKGFKEEGKDPLSGKSKSDSLDSFYNNETTPSSLVQKSKEDERRNSSDDVTPVDERNSKGFKEESKNPLSGKYQTTDIETGKDGRAGKNNYDSDELDQDGEDKEVQKYYKEHNEATQYEGKDLAGKGSKADEIQGHLSSKLGQSSKSQNTQEKGLQLKQGAGSGSKQDNKSSSAKNEEREIYHPSANLDSFFGEEKKKSAEKQKKDGPQETSTTSPTANIYPIRPRNELEQEFAAEEDNDQATGEGSLAEISQTAKVYSFITQGSIKRLCDLDDHFEDIVMLKVSGGDFMELQPVQIDLSFHYLKQKVPLKVDGVIEGIDPDENNVFFVTVRLKGSQLDQFEDFMAMYQKRQSHIHQFLKRAKGL